MQRSTWTGQRSGQRATTANSGRAGRPAKFRSSARCAQPSGPYIIRSGLPAHHLQASCHSHTHRSHPPRHSQGRTAAQTPPPTPAPATRGRAARAPGPAARRGRRRGVGPFPPRACQRRCGHERPCERASVGTLPWARGSRGVAASGGAACEGDAAETEEGYERRVESTAARPGDVHSQRACGSVCRQQALLHLPPVCPISNAPAPAIDRRWATRCQTLSQPPALTCCCNPQPLHSAGPPLPSLHGRRQASPGVTAVWRLGRVPFALHDEPLKVGIVVLHLIACRDASAAGVWQVAGAQQQRRCGRKPSASVRLRADTAGCQVTPLRAADTGERSQLRVAGREGTGHPAATRATRSPCLSPRQTARRSRPQTCDAPAQVQSPPQHPPAAACYAAAACRLLPRHGCLLELRGVPGGCRPAAGVAGCHRRAAQPPGAGCRGCLPKE